ncbi:MAG: prepilin-type N-terminal cleavage/methylation domain-containing protein [Verrucomicrobiota bacterium]
MKNRGTRLQAFTLVELLVVIAILALLAAITLPALAATKVSVQRIYCSSNLKRVGIAFRTWADKSGGRMPMEVSYLQGGASSAIGVRGNGANFAANYPTSTGPRGVWGMFIVMSNELSTPKILACPSDSRTGFSPGSIFGNSVSTNAGCFSDSSVSYFVGVDANVASPSRLLAGDANIGDGATPPTAANIYGEGTRKFISAGTNVSWGATSPNWADTTHAKQGNVAFADGSVQNLTTARLREALNKTGDTGRPAGGFVQASGSLGSGVNRLQFP